MGIPFVGVLFSSIVQPLSRVFDAASAATDVFGIRNARANALRALRLTPQPPLQLRFAPWLSIDHISIPPPTTLNLALRAHLTPWPHKR
jgi:hypothetical protein